MEPDQLGVDVCGALGGEESGQRVLVGGRLAQALPSPKNTRAALPRATSSRAGSERAPSSGL